jgi:hypothetical protein
MREAGVEPARLAALEPKSSASASSATLARKQIASARRRRVYRGSRLLAQGGVMQAPVREHRGPGIARTSPTHGAASRNRSRFPAPAAERAGHDATKTSRTVPSPPATA